MHRPTRYVALAAAAVCASALSTQAEVKVLVDHNAGDKATAEFKFTNAPPTSKVPSTAKITVVDGEKDDACGRDASDLTSAKLPSGEDEPDANFFFNAGTDGGRLAVDLRSAMPVQQVNTYSWHANTRGPQVYKLYAADGTAKDFNAAPKKGTDPTTCGWKLVTTVDTRDKAGEPGGQYAVSVRDTDGALGTYRYLLLDAAKTEGDDDFGNTFFSKIDVVTSAAPAK